MDRAQALAFFSVRRGGLTLRWTWMGFRNSRWSSTALLRMDEKWPQITSATGSSTRTSSAALYERNAEVSMSRRERSPKIGIMWFQIRLRIGPAVEGSSVRLGYQWSTM